MQLFDPTKVADSDRGIGIAALARKTTDGNGQSAHIQAVTLVDSNGNAIAGTGNGQVVGIGVYTAMPTTGNTTTPVAIGTVPSGAIGIELYLPAASSVNANIATAASGGAAAAAAQIAAGVAPVYDNASFGKIYQLNLGTGLNLWISAVTGSPLFRWL